MATMPVEALHSLNFNSQDPCSQTLLPHWDVCGLSCALRNLNQTKLKQLPFWHEGVREIMMGKHLPFLNTPTTVQEQVAQVPTPF